MLTDIRTLIAARRDEKKDEGGFTLIELLIVIVVLGILAAIVVFAVQNLNKDSASTACRADAKSVETALEAFKARNGSYPAATGAFTPIDATNPAGFVGVANYIRSAPKQTKYIIGLKESAVPASAGKSDGLVYVKAPPAAVAAVEFNDPADPCQNAA